MSDLLSNYQQRFDARHQEEMSLMEYLELCKKDPTVYAIEIWFQMLS